jgi:tRNA(fMet)-specific endonuclease VapC
MEEIIPLSYQDLKIASITLAYNGILLTRNLQDFEKVPELNIQNWTN